MTRRPPISTRTDTLLPFPTLFRSESASRSIRTPARRVACPRCPTGRRHARRCCRRRLHSNRRPRRNCFRSGAADRPLRGQSLTRSEEHTSELQSLMRISYAVFCLKKKKKKKPNTTQERKNYKKIINKPDKAKDST